MSQLQTNINLPAIASIDGFVTDGSMTTVMYSVENELDALGNAVGNIYGDGDYQYDDRKFINNLASSIGTEMQDPALPYGASISDVIETHTLSGNKETVLGLVLQSCTSIEGFDNSNISIGAYTIASDPFNMTDTQCFIDGRLILFKNPPYSFTIQYTGTYPTSPSLTKNGYRPNLIPNILSPSSVRPTLSLVSGGRIQIDIVKANAIKTTNTYDDQYDIVFSDYLLPFVDGTGTTPCPKAYISAYKFNTTTYKFDKLNTTNIYIINASRFQIETDEDITVATDVIILSVANTSIKEWVIAAMRELQNHKHDGNDISSPVNHSDLAGLTPRSLNEAINYAKSQIPNNDHPQYLHREGYNDEDTGAYRNAMLGDLFIASTDSSNLFNNIIGQSNKLVFGATSGAGHSIYRESITNEDDLIIASQTNGIRLTYEYNNSQKYGLALQTSGGVHAFGNKIDSNDLLITSKTGKSYFGKFDNGLEAYVPGTIEANTAIIDSVHIGPVSIARNNNNVNISSSNANSSVDYQTKLAIKNNAINGGISFNDGTNVYAKISVSKNDGTTATALDSKTIFGSNGDLYLIKNTTESTTGISTEARATLYAGDTHFYTVGANRTLGALKNGIQLGPDHSIYLTNTGESYAQDVLVVEANSKVLFAKPSLAINIDTPTYTDIHAGNIIAHGEISGTIRSIDTIVNSLTINTNLTTAVDSLSIFNGRTVFNDAITFNDDVTIGVLRITNVGNATQFNAVNSTIENLTGGISSNLKGQVVFSPHVSNTSSFTCNIDSKFNNKVEIAGEIKITNNLGITGTTSITGAATLNTATISLANITTAVVETLTATNLNIDTLNTTHVITDSITQNGAGPSTFGGNITMSTTGSVINLNNGRIENLVMNATPAGGDVPNVEWVNETINNLALEALLDYTYPIGSIYKNAYNPGNPGDLNGPFGIHHFGTWEAFAEGRVIIGAGTATDANGVVMTFINAQESGEYKHTLTIQEIPTHNHRMLMSWLYASISAGANFSEGVSPGSGPGALDNPDLNTSIPPSGYDTGYTGGGAPHNIIQPYVVVRVWIRTA